MSNSVPICVYWSFFTPLHLSWEYGMVQPEVWVKSNTLRLETKYPIIYTVEEILHQLVDGLSHRNL